MPRGFVGMAAFRYLGEVTEAHTNAVNAGNRTHAVASNAMAAVASNAIAASQSNGMISVRSSSAHVPNAPREIRLPFTVDDARSGSFMTGRGDSSNIVADLAEYQAILQHLSQADDKLGECLYNLTLEVETLCRTIFILPSVSPRCLNISDSMKHLLNQFTCATEDLVIQSRKFAEEITNIG